MGKRLFEQGADVAPSLDMRLASGKAGTPTVNHTWQTIVAWLEAGLNFLKKSENLNDLPNKSTARTNLSVYSKAENDAALLEKADVDNVLTLDNTDTYTPTTPFNPTTKAYVDAITPKLLVWGKADANAAKIYETVRPNTYITSVTLEAEGAGSYNIKTGFPGNMKNLKVEIIPTSDNYTTVGMCSIWKKPGGQINFQTANDTMQDPSDFEYYISYVD